MFMNSAYKLQLQKSASDKKKVKSKLDGLSSLSSNKVDNQLHKLHDEVFQKIDCLQCANCCKTTSPIFEQKDIDRIAKAVKMSAGSFITTYLEMDEDGDFVLQSAPCSFLNKDNTCKIYDVRPKACAEYPHTNRKRMQEILDITYENAFVCPAVSSIVEQIK
jgi:Fe-S-cluster containining protein